MKAEMISEIATAGCRWQIMKEMNMLEANWE
jgi:hypothetical protein